MNQQRLIRKQIFAVHFLSPVHIGTGEQLDNHDCLYENGRLLRFRIEPLLEHMNEPLLEQFVHDGLMGVKNWLQRTGLWQSACLYEVGVPREPRWYREPFRPFIADLLHRPYLPGTELKGAIRTALAWKLLQHQNLSNLGNRIGKRQRNNRIEEVSDRRWAGQWLSESLFGSDPNHDLLRCLRVSDSTPVASQRLKVVPVLVAVRSRNGLQWLQTPRSQNQPSQYTPNPSQAVANFCEILDGSVQGITLTVEWDDFLTGATIKKGDERVAVPEELNGQNFLDFVRQWQEACNAFARQVAEREKNWWQEVQRQTTNAVNQLIAATMVRFYEQLLRQMAAETSAVFVNLGWGGGWRTKTVTEFFGDETVQHIVRRYHLDRNANSRPFPKTRKVAWRGGNDYAPLGWLKLGCLPNETGASCRLATWPGKTGTDLLPP